MLCSAWPALRGPCPVLQQACIPEVQRAGWQCATGCTLQACSWRDAMLQVDALLEGREAVGVLMAHGISGSGKTHTIEVGGRMDGWMDVPS